MKTMPIIAQLRSTNGYDTDAPHVYLELDEELLARIEKAVSLYSRHQNDLSLGLSKLTIHGPSMTALVNLPALTDPAVFTDSGDGTGYTGKLYPALW